MLLPLQGCCDRVAGLLAQGAFFSCAVTRAENEWVSSPELLPCGAVSVEIGLTSHGRAVPKQTVRGFL